MNRIGNRAEGIIAYHGTDKTDFAAFDVAAAGPYNVGLHFGTRAAAEARIDYLRENEAGDASTSKAEFRVLKCRLDIRNPFRIDDVFGHSYIGILTALEDEVKSKGSGIAESLTGKVAALIDEYMLADDDDELASHGDAYLAYCHRVNSDIIGIFKSIGYDGLVYSNELEDGASAADSYVVFDARQITILGEEKVAKAKAA